MSTPNLRLTITFDLAQNAPTDLVAKDHETLCRQLNTLLAGFVAGAPTIAAKQLETPPAVLLSMASAQIEQLASSENTFYKKLGGMLKEQLAHPGTMSVKLAPGADIDVVTFGMTAEENPDKLPLEFSSKPGSKSMEEYLK